MIAIAIESSNSRGMGHLFRAILYVNYLKKRNMDYIVLINQDVPSLAILKQHEITYEIVDYQDVTSDWEGQIIKKILHKSMQTGIVEKVTADEPDEVLPKTEAPQKKSSGFTKRIYNLMRIFRWQICTRQRVGYEWS